MKVKVTRLKFKVIHRSQCHSSIGLGYSQRSRSYVKVKVVGEGQGHKIEGQGHTSKSRA